MIGENDTRLWRLIRRLVDKAHAERDWSKVKAIAVDETSAKRGRSYVTVVMDMDTRAVLYLGPGRDSNAVRNFCEQLRAHGGDPAKVRWVAMDMLHCHAKGVRESFPNAQIVYDRYHVMVMAGEAVDEVRRQLQREGVQLKGSLWVLRGNEWNLSPEQRLQRRHVGQDLQIDWQSVGTAQRTARCLLCHQRAGGRAITLLVSMG
jgi:transposase